MTRWEAEVLLHDYEQVEPNVEPTEERLAIEEAAEAKKPCDLGPG
jgi:hypothetical protein